MVSIFVLELESNKYYVGKTKSKNFRLEFKSNLYEKNDWITKYKPIKIIELIPDCDLFDEDKYTLKYIEKKGIENVRGGSFSNEILTVQETVMINKMIKNSSKENNETSIPNQINDFLKNVSNDNIKHKISTIKNIHLEIIKLNNIIKQTDFYYNNLSDIKLSIIKFKKLEKLNEEKNLLLNKFYNTKDKGQILDINKQIHDLNIKINIFKNYIRQNNLENYKNRIYESLENLYRFNKEFYFLLSNYNKCNKYIVVLEIVKFGVETKKRLNEIYKKYHSDKFINELLIKLYEKEIEMNYL